MHQSALGTGLILVVNFTPQHGGGAWDGLYGRKGTVYQQQPLLDFIIVTTRALTTTTPPQPAQLSPFTQPRIQSLHQTKSNNLRPKQQQIYTHNEPKSMPGARSEPQSASDSAKYIALHHIALHYKPLHASTCQYISLHSSKYYYIPNIHASIQMYICICV